MSKETTILPIGTKLIVTSQKYGHKFDIGEEVIIIEIDDNTIPSYECRNSKGDEWFMSEGEFSLVPTLWDGWIATEKEMPPEAMEAQQILMVLSFEKSEPLVICGIWKDGKFHCCETNNVYPNVSHWSCLPKFE
jgi:hypothetical protein